MLEASIKIPKAILYCKQICLYILHTKKDISKGHLAPFCMLFCYLENQFYISNSTVIVYINILRSVLSTSAPVSLTESLLM